MVWCTCALCLRNGGGTNIHLPENRGLDSAFFQKVLEIDSDCEIVNVVDVGWLSTLESEQSGVQPGLLVAEHLRERLKVALADSAMESWVPLAEWISRGGDCEWCCYFHDLVS